MKKDEESVRPEGPTGSSSFFCAFRAWWAGQGLHASPLILHSSFLVLHSDVSCLVGHDVEHEAVGFVHAARADAGEVADALVDVLVDDAFDGGDGAAFHGHDGGEDGGGYAGGDLQGATGFGAVAYHAGEVGYHVLHGVGDLSVVAAHQVGDAATGAGGGNDAAAEGGESSEALFDVDDGQVAEHEGADELFFGLACFFGEDQYGQGGGDALVAAARVAHDGYHGSGHAGVASAGGIGEDVREDAVAHDFVFVASAQHFAQAVSVVGAEGGFGGGFVEAGGLEDEADFVQRGGLGEVVDGAQGQGGGVGFGLGVGGGGAVEQDLSVALDALEAGVSAADDGRGLVVARAAGGFDVQLLVDVFFQGDADALLVDELLAFVHGLGRAVFEHLQLVVRPPDEGAQGDGDGQAYHARAGDADAHGVLQNVGAEAGGDAFGAAAQGLGGAGHAERHGHRFGTADGGDDFAPHQGQDLLSEGWFHVLE